MITEANFKKYLIEKLNKINPGWINEDQDGYLCDKKKADLVNQLLKIAIEIKDDTKYKYEEPPLSGEMVTRTVDLSAKNKQFKDDAQDANKKFRSYPDYKTILLLRTEFIKEPIDVVSYVFSGLRRFIRINNSHKEISRWNKYFSDSSTTEIGGYLLFSGKKYFYSKNPNAKENRHLDKVGVKKILGEEIEDFLIN